MNLLEMVKRLRISFLDDTGGTGVSWEDIAEDSVEVSLLRWSNEELTDFINEAFKKACRGSYLLKDHQSNFNITVVADTNTYSINSKILRIKEARLVSNGQRLLPAELEDVWGLSNWQTRSGVPQYFIQDVETSSILLYPNPSEDDTVELIAYREELTPLNWERNGSSPEVNERYHNDILHYAIYLAYLKDEANTFDPAKAEKHLMLFNTEFSSNSAYAETRRTRSRGRTVAYGGIR